MTPLKPQPNVQLRAVILVLVSVLVWLATSPWYLGIILCAMACIFGTFPRSWISSDHFENEWFVAFFRVYVRRVPVADATGIETDVEDRMGIEQGAVLGLLMGVQELLWTWILDRYMWGDYKLWVRQVSRERILVWQGNGEHNFRSNLETLEDILRLPVTRG